MLYSEKFREALRRYTFAGIIALIVTIALVFLPMFNPDGEIKFDFPQTWDAWLSYLVIRGTSGIAVFTIFVLFDMQGKVNVEKDEKYLNAYKKIYTQKDKKYHPISPAKYKARTYGMKGICIAANTCLLGFVIMDMVLTYDLSLLVAYLVTMLIAVIGGVIQMKKAEIYWTEEFPLWVDWKLERMAEAEKAEAVKEDK